MYENLRKALSSKKSSLSEAQSDYDSSASSLSRLKLPHQESAHNITDDRESNLAAFGQNGQRITLPTTRTSTWSNFNNPSPHSRDSRLEPIGLHVLHDPGETRTKDLIFVHGLGASCRFAWSHNKDLSLFWPKEWLPTEPGFENVRISTFGYNAIFKNRSDDVFNISDFAKDLLFQMKFANGDENQPLRIGSVPISFVCHSMGGLVVKKAYILGSHDPEYQDIIAAVRSVVFLATPHRGSTLADTLNKVLSATFRSPKQYISDLQSGSARIADINDQFKLYQQKLQLVSFFETKPTTIGLSKKTLVVERDSAVLEYPNEISSPLNANHSTMSKYTSRDDPNYVSVKNVLKSLVETFGELPQKETPQVDIEALLNRLGVFPPPFDTLNSLLEPYVTGSCDWTLSDTKISDFLTSEVPHPTILHMTGRPGSGKSMLASFLISHLCEVDCAVQFWYFRHDDQPRRSIRSCLLSLVFQMIDSSPEYAQRFWDLGLDIDSIARLDARKIWENLIIRVLASVQDQPQDNVYWVIDALDEADSPDLLLRLIPSLQHIKFPLRVILFTRSQTLLGPLHRLVASSPSENLSQVAISVPLESLALYIDDQLLSTPWDLDMKRSITAKLLERSKGSYLWLMMVMRELETCDTKEQADLVLDESPGELVEVYRRVEHTVTKGQRPANVELAKEILSWIVCAKRKLKEDDLTEALRKSNGNFLGLKNTASRLCGDFISIDAKGGFSLTHETVKDFLLHSASTLTVNAAETHSRIFRDCFFVLTESRFRMRLKSHGCTGFLNYSCLCWSYHLSQGNTSMNGVEVLGTLSEFFMSIACLTWIEAVALTGQLHVLTTTATTLNFLANKISHERGDEFLPKSHDRMDIIRSWSKDLVKIVGRFGPHLIQHPNCIYSLVPLFCPQSTIISRFLSTPSTSGLKVSGIQRETWEESLAKLDLGYEQRPRAVLSRSSYLGIVTSEKAVNLYNAATFQQIGTLPHMEIIVAAQFDLTGAIMVTCGVKSVKVWDIATGRETCSLPNPPRARPMAVSFSADSSEIIVVCMDGDLRRQSLSNPDGWLHIPWQEFDEPSIGRGGPTPSSLAFSPDGRYVALSHQTRPLTVWSTDTGSRVGRIQRGHRGGGATRSDNSDYARKLGWCAGAVDHIVGIFTTGDIFKWKPMDPFCEVKEDFVDATEIACSPDGRLIVTAGRDGSLLVLDIDNFAILYRLACFVRPHYLAFSPDGYQILDLRDSFCNIWAPEILVNISKQENKLGEEECSNLISPQTSSFQPGTSATALEPITALCVDSANTAFAFGTSRGIVKLALKDSETPIEIKVCTMKIICLALSRGGFFLAVGSQANKVRVRKTTGVTGAEKAVFETKCQSPVQQLLFTGDGLHLMIGCSESLGIWSLEDKTCTFFQKGTSERRGLALHPTMGDTYVVVGVSTIETISVSGVTSPFSWNPEPETQSRETPTQAQDDTHLAASDSGSKSTTRFVSKIISSRWVSQILLQISNQTGGSYGATRESPGTTFALLNTSFLSSPSPDEGPRVRQLPDRVGSLIKVPVGIIVDEGEIRRGTTDKSYTRPNQSFLKEPCRLAFIDHDFWLRTWSLDDNNGHCIKHFFLPQDWIHMESLWLAQMACDGRFLCPKSGEVAIVTGGHKLVGIHEA